MDDHVNSSTYEVIGSHIRIHDQCGACGQAFLARERIVALLGDYGADGYKAYDVFEFTNQQIQMELQNGIISCKLSNCVCLSSSAVVENAIVHTDCYNLFLTRCHARDSLWRLGIAAMSIFPWREAPPLVLPRWDYAVEDVNIVSDVCGLPELKSLPAEMADTIQAYSQSHVLWRYCSVLRLAQSLQDNKHDEAQTHCLDVIDEWDRGGLPTLLTSTAAATRPIIRITIDSRGIKRIERMTEEAASQACPFKADFEVFVVETARKLQSVEARFQLGLCRLNVPSETHLNIWDLPTPPKLSECLLTENVRNSHTRFVTTSMDPRTTTGLTFFVCDGSIIGIHAHTSREPTALDTFKRLGLQWQYYAIWAYVPIAPRDEVVGFGVLENLIEHPVPMYSGDLCLIIRTRLIGKIYIGGRPNATVPCQETVSETPPHPTLIYDLVPHQASRHFGVCPRQGKPTVKRTSLSPGPFPRSNCASAPLEDVICTRVFQDVETRLFKGVIIEYRNGGMRALGQCRLGVDPSQYCVNPVRLCYAEITYQQPGWRYSNAALELKFTSSGSHEHGDATTVWVCREMKGTLGLWFIKDQVKIEAIDDDTEDF